MKYFKNLFIAMYDILMYLMAQWLSGVDDFMFKSQSGQFRKLFYPTLLVFKLLLFEFTHHAFQNFAENYVSAI